MGRSSYAVCKSSIGRRPAAVPAPGRLTARGCQMSRQNRFDWFASKSCFPYGRRRPLRFEPLESRRLLAVVTVNTLEDTINFDDHLTSLREAIFATNTVPGADTIQFDELLTAD